MRGLALINYGVEGIGKTDFSLQFPKELLCISIKESGFEDLEDIGKVPPMCENIDANDYGRFMSALKKAEDYRTVVIDSTSGLQEIVFNEIITQEFEGSIAKFTAYYTGPRKNGPVWMGRITTRLEALRNKGVNVILIGHSRIETIKNPDGLDYSSNTLDMDEGVRSVLTKWAQAVLFMTLDTEVVATKTIKGVDIQGKAKAELEEASDRIIYTTKHPTHSAKNRLDLPLYISMGKSAAQAYENFVKKLPPKVKEHLS